MATATATEVTVEVLVPAVADGCGLLAIGKGRDVTHYRYALLREGYRLEKFAADGGECYFVRVYGGRVTGCTCPGSHYRGKCRHRSAIEQLLAAW